MPKAKSRKAKGPIRADLENAIGITTQHLRDFVAGGALPDGLLAEAKRIADQYQFFHFHLAFSEVFAHGGFDISLENPPWERVNLEARQFFATTRPDIAEAMTSKRRDLLKELETSKPELMREFQDAQRRASSETAFFQNSGVYPHLNQARLNTYILFTELSAKLCSDAGRCGLVVPSGVATDDISKNLFRFLIEGRRIVSLFDFENRDAIFPGVHRSYKFCLLTLRAKGQPQAARLSFFLHQPEQLREGDKGFSLAADELQLLSPLTGLCPTFRCTSDKEIVLPLYRRVKPLAKQQEEKLDWSQGDFLIMFRSDAFPERRERADQRNHTRMLLVELEAVGEIALPKRKGSWETGMLHPLPLWFQWPEKPAGSPKFNHRAFPWVAELRFIASLPGLRDPDVPRRIHDFLKAGGKDRPLVPVKERSWELFADEKAMDSIRRGPLFQPGRLTLEQLRCYDVPASLPCRPGPAHSEGPWLIVENEATFDTFARWNKESGRHRGVILGNGYAIYRATRFILEVLEARGAEYFGDLDRAGCEIPYQFDSKYREAGGAGISPATHYYQWLLDSCGVPAAESPIAQPESWLTWFPVHQQARIFQATRLPKPPPQEAVGWEWLMQHA